MNCEMNIYNIIGEAVEEGFKKAFLSTIFIPDIEEGFAIRYKHIDFDLFSIIFGMRSAPVDSAELNETPIPIFEWYARLDRPNGEYDVILSSDIFGSVLVCPTGYFYLNGREEKDVSQEEALDILLPRVIKRLRAKELEYALEFFAKELPEIEEVQEAMKGWRLYHAYKEI